MRDHQTIPYALPPVTDEASLAAASAIRESLSKRRSCRYFSPAPVAREVIEQAILAAGSAPSGANHQPWHFTAIACPETRRAVRRAAEAEEQGFYGDIGRSALAGNDWLEALSPLGTDADKPFLEIAPWLIVVFAQRRGGIDEDGRTRNYYVNESVGIACGLLLTTLHAAGLATLTHTPSPMGFLRKICGRPEHEKPLMIIVAGHPAPDATVPVHALQKKPLTQIASWI